MATKFGLGAEIQSPTGLSFCMSVRLQSTSKSSVKILMLFSKKNAYVLRTNRLALGKDPDSFVDPGSYSMILYH